MRVHKRMLRLCFAAAPPPRTLFSARLTMKIFVYTLSSVKWKDNVGESNFTDCLARRLPLAAYTSPTPHRAHGARRRRMWWVNCGLLAHVSVCVWVCVCVPSCSESPALVCTACLCVFSYRRPLATLFPAVAYHSPRLPAPSLSLTSRLCKYLLSSRLLWFVLFNMSKS